MVNPGLRKNKNIIPMIPVIEVKTERSPKTSGLKSLVVMGEKIKFSAWAIVVPPIKVSTDLLSLDKLFRLFARASDIFNICPV